MKRDDTMKIIKVDNFNRDYISDQLVCENVNEFYGSKIVESLNNTYSGDNSPVYFRLVKDDYKLYEYEV